MSMSRKRKKAARHQTVPPRDTSAGTPDAADAAARTSPAGQPLQAASLTAISAAIETMVQALDAQPGPRRPATDVLDSGLRPDEATMDRVGPAKGPGSDPRQAHGPGRVEDDRLDQSRDHGQEGGQDQVEDERLDGHRTSRRPGRRVTIAVAVAAPLMFAAAFLLGQWLIGGVESDPPPSPTLLEARSLPTPAARATPAPPASKPSTTPFVPGGLEGPGLSEPGALVQVVPGADGSLEVLERVRFANGATELAIAPPVTKGVNARSLPRGISIADLQVTADQAVVDTGFRGLTRAQTVELPSGTRFVVMRYRLTGATVRSLPSTPGRALTVLPPITSPATLGSMPFVVEVSGVEVSNLLCPGLSPEDQLCGRNWSKGWYSVPQPAGRTAVLAQLVLPDPVGG